MKYKFRNPDELKHSLEKTEVIDFDELQTAWYKEVKKWSYKDIIQGKIIVADYHWKIQRN